MRKLLLMAAIIFTFPPVAFAYTYIQPEKIPATLLEKPAADGSEKQLAEIAEIKKAQKSASVSELAEAVKELALKSDIMAPALGYTRKEQPKLYEFMDKVGLDCDGIVGEAKAYWGRKRPYLVSDIKTLVPPIDNGSYPSGHTACTLVWSEVLAEIFPEKADALRASADETAHLRMVAGVHYPSDLSSGKKLGFIILGALQGSDKYQADLAEIKKSFSK